MLKLLPPMCRDCGQTARAARLSQYLDFHLCQACIGRRERAVLQVEGPRRKATPEKAAKKGKKGRAGSRNAAAKRAGARRRR